MNAITRLTLALLLVPTLTACFGGGGGGGGGSDDPMRSEGCDGYCEAELECYDRDEPECMHVCSSLLATCTDCIAEATCDELAAGACQDACAEDPLGV